VSFSPESRKIFRFLDGSGAEVAIDPHAAIRRFYEALDGEDPDSLMAAILTLRPDPNMGQPPPEIYREMVREARRANDLLVPAYLRALTVPAFEADPARGLTEQEATEVFQELQAFLAGVKKNTGTTPSGPQPTGSSGTSTTSDGSASG
jgi:hypothetical protein